MAMQAGTKKARPSQKEERASEMSAMAWAAVAAARSVAEASGLERCRARAGGMGRTEGRPPMRRTRCSVYGRRAMAGVRSGPQSRSVRAMRRPWTQRRSVMARGRKRPVVGPVMAVARGRRDPERREHRENEGGGVVAGADRYAAGVDARGRDCDGASYGWPVIIVGAAGESGAEQSGAEQSGETLHGHAPCVGKAGSKELPAFIHLN